MAQREGLAAAELRWAKLRLVQDHYRHFIDFLREVMGLLGYSTTELQEDIAAFMEHGPAWLMVQAGRGEAKTTIAAAFAVWCLIHDPSHRILIVSAGGSQANDISTLIVRIITTMPELECMCPDTTNGDRTSVEHFDVHYTLKGVDKSPSVKCLGITANLQGNRAHLLLADDIESTKNATTALQRAQLSHLTLDFSSIVTDTATGAVGRILWLGTPQTSDSIYTALPARGVTVRIWPHRYPNKEQVENYGEFLAPYLTRRMQRDPTLMTGGGFDGTQGKPTDPVLFGEEKLQKKEQDQGTSYFQLQHMLNTRLNDRLRYPLRTDQLVLLDAQEQVPLSIVRGMTPASLKACRVHEFGFSMQTAHNISLEVTKVAGTVAYVDPAGGGLNADETGYAITSFANGNIFARDIGGLPGGYAPEVMEELAKRIVAARATLVKIEKNMGYGAFREVFTPILMRVAHEAGHSIGTDEDYVTGHKERRIIATLEPIINQGRLIVSSQVIERDISDCQRYAAQHRQSYSFFHQLAKITKEAGSLVHDDRLDALEGAVRHWQELLQIDQQRQLEAERAAARRELMSDPLGHKRYTPPPTRQSSILSRYRQ